ncbi:MAG TPA: beta-propeller fold lactonase family protein [Pyrinomonadaceae bacterium]|jgi:6-phosphogluconolactonase (cycloisomerase 2 family)
MFKKLGNIAAVVSIVLLTAFPATAQKGGLGLSTNFNSGAVYVLTNQVQNSIAVFNRNNKDGTLTPAGTFPTGGAGNPVAIPPDPPVDPLASQGSLVLRDNLLFAVNAGSNEISVLRVGKSSLTLVDKVASGGIRPISLTVYDDLLYVLNEGGTPNITGFTIGDDGTLTPIEGSTRPLVGGSSADPAEVGFSPDGSILVVTEKMGNRLDTYTVSEKGLPGAPVANPSSGLTPFGFAFNDDGYLVVSEAFAIMPGQGKVSSYEASFADGILSVVSGSIPNGQTASCWVVIGNSGKYAYISNTGSGTISSYYINDDGTLELARAVAGSTGAGSAPIDSALSVNGHYLYVADNGRQMVHAFALEKDGTLTLIDDDGGLPFGMQGIAAK